MSLTSLFPMTPALSPVTSPAPSLATAQQPACCRDFAVSRRRLLGGAAAVAGTTMVLGSAVVTLAPAAPASADEASDAVMVVLSMRGAADGLSLVVPYTDQAYYAGRPRIGIKPDQLVAETKNGTFGLHPELAPLLPLWTSGQLAAVTGTGLPAPNRSHFSAMDELEDADPGSAARVGWLNRLIGTVPGTTPLQAFDLSGGVVPTELAGPQPVMSAGSVDDVGFGGDDKWDDGTRLTSLHTLWDGASGPLGTSMRSAFGALSAFKPVESAADHTSTYPNTDLGRALAQVARVIRGDVGVRVITVDHGNWDMHSDLGTVEWGRMKDNAAELAGALAAFFADLGPQRNNVTLVALSEFGRRVAENDSYGLDHGYGNVMFLAGAGVKGGNYYGTMPPLSSDLDADVTVTTDYRSVLSEVVTSRFGASSATVFPDFLPQSVGVMSGA